MEFPWVVQRIYANYFPVYLIESFSSVATLLELMLRVELSEFLEGDHS
jgi:hypothetical protein